MKEAQLLARTNIAQRGGLHLRPLQYIGRADLKSAETFLKAAAANL